MYQLGKGVYNLSAVNKWQMVLFESAGVAAAPNLDISTTGSLSLSSAAAKGDDDTSVTRTMVTKWSATTTGILKFTHDPVIFTATVGTNFEANWAVILYSGVATPFAIFQMSTAEVVANQITVNCPADGVFRMANDQALTATVTMA
jgi:hypothetical protein